MEFNLKINLSQIGAKLGHVPIHGILVSVGGLDWLWGPYEEVKFKGIWRQVPQHFTLWH